MKRFLIASFLLVFGCLTLAQATTAAISGGSWQAGRIIDDAIFTDKDAMTPIQIQQFLNAQLADAGGCDTHGTGMVTYRYPDPNNSPLVTTTRALYSYRKGNGAVTVIKPDNIPDADNAWYTDNTWFRCLNDYWENPNTGANNYANRPIPDGAASAAQLIWFAAQAQNISPKTLLVTLQKEQGLLSDTWPFQVEYLHAMGAYCPDTAPCDPAHEQFGKQMNDGAALFRYYLDNMNQPWWTYKKPGVNGILYNPNTSCGASNVYIQNKATAALYTYTPYQPNDAALANLYGTGDGCSSYGNRNFWRNFSDWFGTTYADGYVAQFAGQSDYPAGGTAGQVRSAYIQYKNMGSTRWYDSSSAPAGISPVNLAATNPINRASIFSQSWPMTGRPNLTFSKVYESNGTTLAANQHVAEPGQIVRFEFNFTIPLDLGPGVYREYFQPVAEGAKYWAMGGLAYLDVTVLPTYQATYFWQSNYPTLVQNSVTTTTLEYKNTGAAAWYDVTSAPNGVRPITLAATNPINRRSIFSQSWPSESRPNLTFSKVYESNGLTLAANQHIVQPGQVARFDFNITTGAGTAPGKYREYFQPIVEGAQFWNIGGTAWIDVTVVSRSGSAQFVGQSGYPSSPRGQANPVFISYRNNTNTIWYDDLSAPLGISAVHLATTNPSNRRSIFSYGWPSSSRPSGIFSKVYESNGTSLAANQHIASPGQIVRYDFNLTVPWGLNPGVYQEFFQPIIEGTPDWSIGGVAWLNIGVTNN